MKPMTARQASMRLPDLFHFSAEALFSQRFRGIMILLAMGLGVAAVVVLTALGEGARGYIIKEFSGIGKDILVIVPGRNETTGGMPPMGASARDITLDEAYMLPRRIAALKEVAPIIIGSTEISYGDRSRSVIAFGTTAMFARIHQLGFIEGKNFSEGDFMRAANEVILGITARKAMFDNRPAIGEQIRIGDSRFRVVGVLEEGGDSMGMDFNEAIMIPVMAAQRQFNVEGLFRVIMQIREGYEVHEIKKRVEETMREFHQGELDVTIISPDAMRASFDEILATMTLAIAAIGAISLLVAGILIMNVMLISVSQRTREIGLLKALGASSRNILNFFLAEALLITGAGSLIGLVLGSIIVWIGTLIFPEMPFRTPLWAYVSAVVIAIATGLAFSWLPARRASRLQPLTALQKQ